MFGQIEASNRFPMTIHLTLTRNCNVRCSDCRDRKEGQKNTKEMSTEEWFDVIDKVTEVYGHTAMIVKGGEPMLRPDFFKIIGHIKSKGHYLSVITNGTLIQDVETARKLESFVDQMEIFLDGFASKTTDPLKGDRMFDRIMRGIGLIRNTRIKLGLSFDILEEEREIPWEALESVIRAENGEQIPVRADIRGDFPLGERLGSDDFFDFLRQTQSWSCPGQMGSDPVLKEFEIDAEGGLHPYVPVAYNVRTPAPAL